MSLRTRFVFTWGVGGVNILVMADYRPKRGTKGPCKVCGKPQRQVVESKGYGRTRIVYRRTCGDPACIRKLTVAGGLRKEPPTQEELLRRKIRRKEWARLWRYKTILGLTPEDVSRVKASSCGLCAICRKPGNTLDHNHITHYVRGWLCPHCNVALSVLERPTEWLEKARAYLESPPCKDMKIKTN